MTRPVFSAELFNARIETQIQAFFDSMNNLYGRRGWRVDPPIREESSWRNMDYTVEITSRYHDGAYKRIRFTMRNLPSYIRRPESLTSDAAIRWVHIFVFDLPREYPQNIGTIRPAAETPLYHPRLSTGGRGHACYSVRGELDRILEDLPFFVLLKPDRVEPPSQFKSDHGLNSAAMSWYEQEMENIVTTLDRLWEERHTSHETTPRGRVVVLDSSASRQSTVRSPRILDESSASRRSRVRILEDEDEQ